MNNLSQILNSATMGQPRRLRPLIGWTVAVVLFRGRTVWGNAARGVGGIQTSAKSRHTAQPREHRLGVPNAPNFSRLPLAH